MADKKKKSPAESALKSSRKKLISDLVETYSPDDAKPEITTTQSALKANPTKAIKQLAKEPLESQKREALKKLDRKQYNQAVKSGKLKKIKSEKTPLQAALTATPNKAIKGLIQEPFRIAKERQIELNKEYRRERAKLIRRIGYFARKGYEFNAEEIAPKLTENATVEDIQALREIRGNKLRDLATGFTPPAVPNEAPISSEISELLEETGQMGIEYTDDMFETDPNNFIEEDDFHPSFEDLVYTEPEPFFRQHAEFETPQERYYRENGDRKFGGADSSVNRGEAVYANAWSTIRGTDLHLSIHNSPQEVKNIVSDAAIAIGEMLAKAEDALGHDALVRLLEMHAEEFNHNIEKALRDYYRKTIYEVQNEVSFSLTQISNILFSSDSALLAEYSTGNPADL